MKDMLRMQDAEFLGNKLSLEEVQRQFEHWRKERKLGEELIPEQLCEAAVCLSQDYPISKISQALRLSDLKLKNHISKTNKKGILKPDKNSPPCFFFCQTGFKAKDIHSTMCCRNGKIKRSQDENPIKKGKV
jgi:hypothetical protein